MNTDRIALAVLAAACLGGMAACQRTHVPSDAQLTRLLHVERASATDAGAPLDASAVECLKAWSGDVEMVASLPPSMTGDPAKQACRKRVDGWIADATRNPDKIGFDDVAAPASVRRAMALLAEHRANLAQSMPAPSDQPPRALVTPNAVPTAPAAPDGPIDLGAASAAVDELDTLCQKATQAAASGDTSQPLSRYASYCPKRIEQLRARISVIQQHGNSQQAKVLTDNVQRTLVMARQIAAGGPARGAASRH
jgi:hypothetical protein